MCTLNMHFHNAFPIFSGKEEQKKNERLLEHSASLGPYDLCTAIITSQIYLNLTALKAGMCLCI